MFSNIRTSLFSPSPSPHSSEQAHFEPPNPSKLCLFFRLLEYLPFETSIHPIPPRLCTGHALKCGSRNTVGAWLVSLTRRVSITFFSLLLANAMTSGLTFRASTGSFFINSLSFKAFRDKAIACAPGRHRKHFKSEQGFNASPGFNSEIVSELLSSPLASQIVFTVPSLVPFTPTRLTSLNLKVALFKAPCTALCCASIIFFTLYTRLAQFHAIHITINKLTHPLTVTGNRVLTHAVGWLW